MKSQVVVSVTLAVALGGAALLLAGCGSDESGGRDAAIDAARIDAAACGGLDLATCRRTPGCAADLCPACGCDLSYRGCLHADEVPAGCPALGCPSLDCCRGASDCTAGSCLQPGEQACGGACNPHPNDCTRDDDCRVAAGGAAVLVCDPVPCSCNGGANACVPGCVTSADCDEGQTCTPATGRCAATACGPAAPCPLDFDCATGACHRRTCTTDVDCDGFCVDGACHGALGACHEPVP